MNRILAICCLILLSFQPLAVQAASLDVKTLRIGGHDFIVEIARTTAQKNRGLMFRKKMARDHGMLFPADKEQELRMWMKNTLLPLDMIFIGSDGRIVGIVPNTKPKSLDIISIGKPSRAVLELLGGTAEMDGIHDGDRVSGLEFAQ